MTAAAADRDPKYSDGMLVSAVPKASTTIYGGTLVNTDDTTGKAEPATDASGKHFAGIANDHVVADDAHMELRRKGVYSMVCASADATWRQAEVCIVDSQTVALAATTTADIKCGRVVEVVSATEVRVAIDGYC